MDHVVNCLKMDKELYFYRCFVRTNHLPRITKREPFVRQSGVELFVEEAIAHVFFCRGGTEYVPPTKIQELKALIPRQIYFHEYIGVAINHQCAIDDTIRFAEEDGFIVDLWLQLHLSNARDETQRYLDIVRRKTRPINLGIIHVLAFAGFLSRMAVQAERTGWVEMIVWRVIHLFQKYFPFEWIYYDARQWAMAYNVRHFEIHNQSKKIPPRNLRLSIGNFKSHNG